MTSIHFEINKIKDARNWWDCANHSFYGVDLKEYIPTEILKALQNTSKNKAIDKMGNYFNQLYAELGINEISVDLQLWRSINGKQIFSTMEETIGKKIPVSIIEVTLTTIRKCPYNPKNRWCMYYPFDTNGNKKPIIESIRSIVHELLHMMLHYYYEDYIKENGISESQFHHLKESQTVILNDIYMGILPKPDKGYEIHAQLREEFLRFWKKNKNFDKFVDYNIAKIGEFFT